MASDDGSGLVLEKLKDFFGASGGTAGPTDQANSGMRLPRPYAMRYVNGIFVGHDFSLWKFFKTPLDVKTSWANDNDIMNAQMFFTEIIDTIGQRIDNKSKSTTKKDTRMRFHASFSKETAYEIEEFDGISPSHSDFIQRMATDNILGKPFVNQRWYSYVGFQLIPGSIFHDTYGVREKISQGLETFRDTQKRIITLYKSDLEFIDNVCLENGMRPISFVDDPLSEELLTAWFGAKEDDYGVKRNTEYSRFSVPDHGNSIITPRWGEVTMSSIKPIDPDEMEAVDPIDPGQAQFGNAILHPESKVVHMTIRGEIRSSGVAARVIENKEISASNRMSDDSLDSSARTANEQRVKQAQIALVTANRTAHAMLDNTEITVATVVDGKKNKLNDFLRGYGLESVPVSGRQHLALCSTIPTYPNSIYKIPGGNIKRNPNTNVFYAGVLAMSGMFGSVKPCSDAGVLVGMSESTHDFREIYTSICDGQAPVMLFSGETGSGKAFPLTTPVLTVSGWKPLADVEVGDELVGLDGKPTRVMSLSPIYEDHGLTEFVLSDNRRLTSDGDHQWLVDDSRGKDVALELIEKLEAGTSVEDADRSVGGYFAPGEVSAMESMIGPHSSNKVLERLRQRVVSPDGLVRLSTDEIVAVTEKYHRVRIPALRGAVQRPRNEAYPSPEAIFYGESGDDGSAAQRADAAYDIAVAFGYENGDTVRFDTVERSVIDLFRSLGSIVRVSDDGIDVTPHESLPTSDGSVVRYRADSMFANIVALGRARTVPVRCLTVDNDSRSFVIDGYTPTSNTVQALMMFDQAVREGYPGFFLNPKPRGLSPAPLFDMHDGVVIKMEKEYLNDNPGLLDPCYYMKDPEDVAKILCEMILGGLGVQSKREKETIIERTVLNAELLTRARMPENKCSRDIIFGNIKHGTPKLSNNDVLDFVFMKTEISPFWKASISADRTGVNHLFDKINTGKPVYIEWGSSLSMPNTMDRNQWTDNDFETVQSVVNLFTFSTESVIRQGGGVVAIDEAHNLKTSEEAMNLVRKAGKEWRAANIELWLMTQNLGELVNTKSKKSRKNEIVDITGSIGKYVIMSINENEAEEIDIFYDLSNLPRTEETTRFITNGKVDRSGRGKRIPTAYFINTSENDNWAGGVICGPWPASDFKAASGKVQVKAKKKPKQVNSGSVMDDLYEILDSNARGDGV